MSSQGNFRRLKQIIKSSLRPSIIALRSSRQEATAEQGKLMAAHMKFFLRCGGRSHRFSVINTFAEMNELHHS